MATAADSQYQAAMLILEQNPGLTTPTLPKNLIPNSDSDLVSLKSLGVDQPGL